MISGVLKKDMVKYIKGVGLFCFFSVKLKLSFIIVA